MPGQTAHHRRCQYQGEGCLGTAHGGHDQCAHCFYHYVKPALQAERQEMKRRRALKRGRLAGGTTPTALVPEQADLLEPLQRPISIRAAIRELEIDHMLEGKTGEQRVETLVGEAVRLEIAEVPATIYPILKKEIPTVPKPNARPQNRSPLSDDQKAEIVEAYRSGLPTPEIESAYKIGSQTLYTLVRRAGVPFRGQGGQKYQPPRTASEPPTVTPTEEPATVLETSPNGTVPLTQWTVTYSVTRTETVVVTASNPSLAFMEFNMAHDHGVGYDVVSIVRVRS